MSHGCRTSDLSDSEMIIVDSLIAKALSVLGCDSESVGADSLCSDMRMYRAARKMKLQELADIAGVTRDDVWAVESGRLRDLTDERVQKLIAIVKS